MSISTIAENVLQQRELDNEYYLNNKKYSMTTKHNVESSVECNGVVDYSGEQFVKFTFRMDNSTNVKISRSIGNVRVKQFIEFFKSRYSEDRGYSVVVPKKKKGDFEPDILILKDNVPYMVIEIKNYKVEGYMMAPTLERAIKALTKYNCYRLLIVSSLQNLRIRKRIPKPNPHYIYKSSSHTIDLLRKYNIDVMYLGRQDIDFKDIFRIFNKKEIQGWIE